jgi:hypothetical protein
VHGLREETGLIHQAVQAGADNRCIHLVQPGGRGYGGCIGRKAENSARLETLYGAKLSFFRDLDSGETAFLPG